MELATFFSSFLLGIILGLALYSMYTAFGANAQNLRDPFVEHED